MSGTITAVKGFNTILIEFMKNLEDTFTEDKDFKTYRLALVELIKYNTIQPSKMFKKFVSEKAEIRQRILEKDASFFTEQADYNEVKHVVGADGFEDTITKLKSYWSSLSEPGKAKVFKYLEALIKVSDSIN